MARFPGLYHHSCFVDLDLFRFSHICICTSCYWKRVTELFVGQVLTSYRIAGILFIMTVVRLSNERNWCYANTKLGCDLCG